MKQACGVLNRAKRGKRVDTRIDRKKNVMCSCRSGKWSEIKLSLSNRGVREK